MDGDPRSRNGPKEREPAAARARLSPPPRELGGSLLSNTPFLDDLGLRWEADFSFALTPAVDLSVNFQHVDPLSEQTDEATALGLRLRCAF